MAQKHSPTASSAASASASKSPGRSDTSGKSKPRPKYDISEFRLPAHDATNQSVPVSYRTPPQVKAIYQQAVIKFPFVTEGNAHRLADQLLFRYLATLTDDAEFKGMAKDIEFVLEVVQKAENIAQLAQVMMRTDAAVKQLMSLNLRPIAVRMVYDLKRSVREKVSDPVMQEYFRREIRERFGDLGKVAGNKGRGGSGSGGEDDGVEAVAVHGVVGVDQFAEELGEGEGVEHGWGWDEEGTGADEGANESADEGMEDVH